jgi:hypothetical protein
MLSMPDALPLPLGGGREGLAERNDRRSKASPETGKPGGEFSIRLAYSGRFFATAQNLFLSLRNISD